MEKQFLRERQNPIRNQPTNERVPYKTGETKLYTRTLGIYAKELWINVSSYCYRTECNVSCVIYTCTYVHLMYATNDIIFKSVLNCTRKHESIVFYCLCNQESFFKNCLPLPKEGFCLPGEGFCLPEEGFLTAHRKKVFVLPAIIGFFTAYRKMFLPITRDFLTACHKRFFYITVSQKSFL